MYWTDNIQLTNPHLLFEETEFNFSCGHKVISDIPDDIKWCVCGALVAPGEGTETQEAWQRGRFAKFMEEVA
jgi:hypothetical protein